MKNRQKTIDVLEEKVADLQRLIGILKIDLEEEVKSKPIQVGDIIKFNYNGDILFRLAMRDKHGVLSAYELFENLRPSRVGTCSCGSYIYTGHNIIKEYFDVGMMRLQV